MAVVVKEETIEADEHEKERSGGGRMGILDTKEHPALDQDKTLKARHTHLKIESNKVDEDFVCVASSFITCEINVFKSNGDEIIDHGFWEEFAQFIGGSYRDAASLWEDHDEVVEAIKAKY